MAETSKIEWTDASWNPVTGCNKISPGCKHCYAEVMAKRLQAMGQPKYADAFAVRLHEEALSEPLHWRKPRRVFVCSMSDLFHKDVPDAFIELVFDVMKRCPQHTFQVLTKRAPRLAELAPHLPWPDNIHAGVSVECQEHLWRIQHLVTVPARVRFVSAEPLLGRLTIPFHLLAKHGEMETPPREFRQIDWVIAGGESGANARPCHPDWIRFLRDDCRLAGTAFFFKQWGAWEPFYDRDIDDPDWRHVPKESDHICRLSLAGGSGFHGERLVYFRRVGKKKSGATLDGREWRQTPFGKGDACPAP